MDSIRRSLYVLMVLWAVAMTGSVMAADDKPQAIVVGGYDFPPFVMTTRPYTGVTLDLIDALNRLQSDYDFRFQEITANRRYQDFTQGRIDLMLFEQPVWGWQGLDYLSTRVIARDSEVYIAHQKPGRDQSFFDELENRRLIGYLGYHYGFAGMESDERRLREQFDITLSRNHQRNLQLILLNRPDVAEVAIITRAYLHRELAASEEYRDRLLISEKVDQVYRLRGLLRPGSALPVETLDAMLAKLEKKGVLPALRQRYRLSAPD